MTGTIIVTAGASSSSSSSGGSMNVGMGMMMNWKDASTVVPLGNDEQINDLAGAGKLTLMKTGVVLNCPIIKVMGGGQGSS
jgi:hypothetical protein